MSSAVPMQQAKTNTAGQTAQQTSQLAGQNQQISTSDFADLRSQATTQRQRQDAANQSPQSRQLKAFQQMAQDSGRATQLKSLGAMKNAPAVQRMKEEDTLQAKTEGTTVQRSSQQTAQLQAYAQMQKNSQTVIQCSVERSRARVKNREDAVWYSSHDEHTFFVTKEAAEKYDRTLIGEKMQTHFEKVDEKREQSRNKRKRKYEAEISNKYDDYVPPTTSTARVYKGAKKGEKREFDDLDIFKLDIDNAKNYSEKIFRDRKLDKFETQVMELSGHHYVLQPGQDIGLTPTRMRPDMQEGHENLPLERDGKAQTYASVGKNMDQIVERCITKENGPKETRIRIGKDLDRQTRGSDVGGSIEYKKEELDIMSECAAILRLDKGRVPDATKYIRETITSGNFSFTQLLGEQKKYVGAIVSGGVAALRLVNKNKKYGDDAYLSDGSDIDEHIHIDKKRKVSHSSPTVVEEKDIVEEELDFELEGMIEGDLDKRSFSNWEKNVIALVSNALGERKLDDEILQNLFAANLTEKEASEQLISLMSSGDEYEGNDEHFYPSDDGDVYKESDELKESLD
ncbi:hypothetical protein [Undibacterium flavidum]|uniref:Uncharacterized protein n=1 Tax=Undibacterium flavidum TaxID=2762297 RepID=A0ABR6YGC4_9BURK|nr:hypothetical protein [Undibacterium flavidum]MBC3875567.1 hypothetical protein [Undibacterium flavidum]